MDDDGGLDLVHVGQAPSSVARCTGTSRLETTSAIVVPGLWLGGVFAPVPDRAAVVVTLDETAPPLGRSGVIEVRAPFLDSRWQPVDRGQLESAVEAAADKLDGGVYIRCRHGLNRSALVAALALRTHGWQVEQAVAAIRDARPGALGNPYFGALVHAWPRDPMRGR